MPPVTAFATDRLRASSSPDNRPIAWWLLLCAAMVLAMAVIGAITRLTESGLSMVEWKPLIGILPPLSDAEWNRVFDLYKSTPEFRIFNNRMDLAGFQEIFWWEWFHRLWGQVIGFVFLFPFLRFWIQGRIAADCGPNWPGCSCWAVCRGNRLVHGQKRAGRSTERQPLPARPASGNRDSDLRPAAAHGAWPA